MCFLTASTAAIAAGTTLAETASPFVTAAAAAPAAAGGASGLSWLSGGLGLVGAGLSGLGQVQRGYDAAAVAAYNAQVQNYQAQVAENNRKLAIQSAELEERAGAREAELKSLETAARVGKVKASQAASGVDITSESAVDVQASERELGKIDTETALSNRLLKAYGYRSKATAYEAEGTLRRAQAGLYEFEGPRAITGSYLGAAGTLLSKASTLPLGTLFA